MSNHRFYELFFSFFFRRIDPEKAHYLGAFVITLSGLPIIKNLKYRFSKPHPSLHVSTLGLNFSSPFGMAAGFDKKVNLVPGLYALGFGHVEVGTITAHAQPGNEKPRLFRLIKDRSLINRMGFNNPGADVAAKRLTKLHRQKRRPIIGVNMGKSRIVSVENAVEDYVYSAQLLAPFADYLVVNVSSPNTPGLRGLQEINSLKPLLRAIKKVSQNVPLLLKIAPDLSDSEVKEITSLALELGLQGIIATNTTISRKGLSVSEEEISKIGDGGLSGPPLKQRSLEILSLIKSLVPDDFCIVSVGGVETAEDVAERIKHGAHLVQGYTGFVYNGPLWASKINKELFERNLLG